MTRISLFLGAGASIPFGMPTTKEFKSKLSKEVSDDNNKKNILNLLLGVKDHEDIEHTLRAIDDIENLGKYGKDFLLHLSNYTSENTARFFPIIKELQACKKNIIEKVYSYYSFKDEQIQNIQKQYDSIFNILNSQKIHVFTTNYDQIIEEYVRKKEGLTPNDGFKHDDSTSRNIFNSDNFDKGLDDKKIINIYKLHGSLNWKKMVNDIIRQDREELNHNESENLLIAPTLDPKNGLDDEPFSSLNRRFEDHCKNTDIFMIIGYAFRDSHVNKIFKKFIDDGKKIIVISPSVTDDLRVVGFPQNNSQKIPVDDDMMQVIEKNVSMKKQLDQANKRLDQAWKQFEQAMTQLDQARKQLDQAIKSLNSKLNLDKTKQIYEINAKIESKNMLHLVGYVLKRCS